MANPTSEATVRLGPLQDGTYNYLHFEMESGEVCGHLMRSTIGGTALVQPAGLFDVSPTVWCGFGGWVSEELRGSSAYPFGFFLAE